MSTVAPGDRLAVGVGDPAAHDHHLGAVALGAGRHPVAVGARRGGGVEGPLHRRRRGVRVADEVDVVHRGGQAEHVRQQDELVAVLGAGVPGADQEVQPGQPLLGGRLGLADEGVQVADQRADQLVEPRVVALHLAEHGVEQRVQPLVAQRVGVVIGGSPVVGGSRTRTAY